MKSMLLIWISFALVLVGLLLCWSRTESYCFFYPNIDTRFAPGYSDKAFSLISTGMTSLTVSEKLGVPLYTHTNRHQTVYWSYSEDGKCGRWADFAWLARCIIFSNGIVVGVDTNVYYD